MVDIPWFHVVLVITLAFALLALSALFYSSRSVIDFYYALHESETSHSAPLPVFAVFSLFGIIYGIISTAIILAIDWRLALGNTFWRSLIVTLSIYVSTTLLTVFAMAIGVNLTARLVFVQHALRYHNVEQPVQI